MEEQIYIVSWVERGPDGSNVRVERVLMDSFKAVTVSKTLEMLENNGNVELPEVEL